MIGANKFFSIFVNQYLRPENGYKILDIGCGTADILKFLPDVEYVGIDMNYNYIQAAEKQFGDRGSFLCKKIGTDTLSFDCKFNLIMAIGVLHHLGDDDAALLFKVAKQFIHETGRVITVDPCVEEHQTKFVQFIFAQDRGKFIRTRDDYIQLSSAFFSSTATIPHDLIHIPFTHIIMECYHSNR